MIDPSYERALMKAFENLHGCMAYWIETVPVLESFDGRTIWEGDVEVFKLAGHAEATRGYAWAYDKAKGSEIVCVLDVPPVTTPQKAVQAAILAGGK